MAKSQFLPGAFDIKTTHVFNFKGLLSAQEKSEYIIPNLSVLEAVRLYQETDDDKYVNHVFFSNFGYFIRAITRSLAVATNNMRFSDARDYLYLAYEAVKIAMKKYDPAKNKSKNPLPFLSGRVWFYILRQIERDEAKYNYEVSGFEEDYDDDQSPMDFRRVTEYKDYMTRKSSAAMNAYDVKSILNELFEVFKDKLSYVGINSVEDMRFLYGELQSLPKEKRSALLRLRNKMRKYLRSKYGDWFSF